MRSLARSRVETGAGRLNQSGPKLTTGMSFVTLPFHPEAPSPCPYPASRSRPRYERAEAEQELDQLEEAERIKEEKAALRAEAGLDAMETAEAQLGA